MKTLIIAEKPSVAGDIARALGKVKKQGDHYENDELVISSAVGHLVELYMPEDIDKKLKRWTLAALPIMPDKFDVKPIEKTKKKFQDLKKLIGRKDIGTIINACDAGREGELIFAYLYQLTKCKKPMKRMWMLSMTEQGIRESYEHLRGAEEMKPLEDAARCRSESDWLIGINGTRAITTRMYGSRGRQAATVGRVQTPTLTMVIERENEIRNFEPRPYWKISGNFGIHSGEYLGVYQKPKFKKSDDEHDRVDRIWEEAEANRILEAVKAIDKANVSEEKKRSKQMSPRLYDLTSLQREANTRFGFPAGMTLQVAQKLYEKHKVITYPRTDSKVLPEDYMPTCEKVMMTMSGELGRYAEKIIKNDWIVPNKRIFDNKKVSDHFAIIPTDQIPKKLDENEAKIYDMISKRFLAVFYPAAEYDVTTRMSVVGEHSFKTEGKVLAVPGWLEVYQKDGPDKDTLPALGAEDGNPAEAKVLNAEVINDETKPPPRYTEATLLSAMEGAGKLLEDDELAEAMKERGLGTPATRAQIIDHLIREKYIDRVQRELIPSVKGENLISFLMALKVEGLTSPAMTGEWEHQLSQIQSGEMTREKFMDGIKAATSKLVDAAKEFDEKKLPSTESSIISPTDNKPFLESLRMYRSQDDEMVIYKTIGNRRMSEEEIKELIEKGRIGPLDGFRSKAGSPYSAMLELGEDKKVKFIFDGSADADEDIDLSQFEAIGTCPLAKKGLCATSDAKVYETSSAYACENFYNKEKKCKFRVSRTLLERAIPREQFLKLMNEGKTDLLDQFKSRKTKRFFSAYLILKEDGGIGFEFEPKKKKVVAKKETKKKDAKEKEKEE